MIAELVAPEETIIREIADKRMKRRDVAQTYWFCMAHRDRDTINWQRINAAIIARWSESALIWIKNQAYTGRCWR